MDHPPDVIDRFTRQMADPAGTQARDAGQDPAGRGGQRIWHGHLARIRSDPRHRCYRRAVPLSSYEDLRPWIEGDPGALTGEAPLSFLSTSASAGRPKRIPYTAAFRDSILWVRAGRRRLIRADRHNPFSEAQFKTLKYRPDFPDRFGSREHARSHYAEFFSWYNVEHHHVGLGLLTPHDVHHGLANLRIAHRADVLAAAFAAHPERFVRGAPTPPPPPISVWINRPKEVTTSVTLRP
jgi:hypothetical protein